MFKVEKVEYKCDMEQGDWIIIYNEYFTINGSQKLQEFVAEFMLQQILTKEEIEELFTRFNADNYCGCGWDFETEEDAQKCADYLNEVYLPAIKLMGC